MTSSSTVYSRTTRNLQLSINKNILNACGIGTLTSDGDPWDTIRRFTMKNLNSLGFGKKSTESLILSDIEELVTSLSKGVGKSLDFKDKFYIPATNHLWFILTGEEIRDKPYFRDALASLHK